MKNVVLETSRLIIRECSVQDVDALKAVFGDLEVMRYSLKGALDRDGIVESVEKIVAHYDTHGYGLWGLVLKETNQLIGIAGLINQLVDDLEQVELGYRLARKYWGQGLATEAARAIKEHAFETLKLERIISIIDPSNVLSSKVADRVGMSRIKSTTFHGFCVDIYAVERIVHKAYTSEWKRDYEAERDQLRAILEKQGVAFHHIGSTAIPGCETKPVIDIMGVTNEIGKLDAFKEALEAIGYIALGEYGMKQRRFFRKRGARAVNLHIFEDSDPEVARHLRFRDFLTGHPEEVKRYCELKKELASRSSADSAHYVLGKETFIKAIDAEAAKADSGTYWNRAILPRKSSWTQDDILHAMDANMQLHMTYFAKYIQSMRLVFEPDVTVVMSDIADDSFNYVISARFNEKNLSSRVSHILDLYKSKNLPFSWWIGERDEPEGLAGELIRQGLSPKEDDIGMSLSLEGMSFSRSVKELSIERIETRERLVDFAKVVVAAGVYPLIYEQLLSEIPPVLYHDGAPFEIYVGYFENLAVVTGILVLHANVAGIYYIMTDPSFRKRGFGTEMMISLLLRAKERGYRLATLQASESGRSLYQKLGFEQNCHFVEYALSEVSAEESKEENEGSLNNQEAQDR